MKKTLILILPILLILSGCTVTEKGGALIKDAKTSYENVKEETQEVVTKVQDTKEKLDETISDVQNAVEQVKEAKEAIDAITK
mgnify:CR=1 FL=1